jgi:NADPH:quinone reductase-like Zn-dependent oxidoreductase
VQSGMTYSALLVERANDPLRLVKRHYSRPLAMEAVVRMRASSLNPHDAAAIAGQLPGLLYPRVPGTDGAGEVVEVGEGVDWFLPGDRVMPNVMVNWIVGRPTPESRRYTLGDHIDGCLQEFVRLPANCLVRVPAHLTDIEAATLPSAGLTAWSALVTEARIHSGQTVLLQGLAASRFSDSNSPNCMERQ